MPLNELFDRLAHALGVEPDRKGECWIACPFCGKEEDHFSFSERGFHCFVCGESGSLKVLQEKLGTRTDEPYRYVKPKPKPARSYRWQENAGQLLAHFETHPRLVELWQRYRPFTAETIRRWHLGVGVLAACRCKHRRLIYPAFADGQIVAFRGRTVECACDKWLQSAGSQVVLWGFELLEPGAKVIVAESPVDAMLAMQEEPSIVAVASTAGAGTWRAEWTEIVRDSRPSQVVVWYDNDLAGSPSPSVRSVLAEAWHKAHPQIERLPRANGPWVANQLLKAGIPALLYRWPVSAPPKADLGSALMGR